MQSQTPPRLTFLPTTGDRVGWLTCDNSTEDAMSTTNLPLSGELAKQLEDAARAQRREPAELLEGAVKQYLEDRSRLGLVGWGGGGGKGAGKNQEKRFSPLVRGAQKRPARGGWGPPFIP